MAIGGALTDWQHGTHGAPTTLTSFTAKTFSVTPSFDAETVEQTTFGDTSRDYEMSFKNATVEAVYKYDTTIFGQLADLYANGTAVSFQYSPDGTASTKPKVTGTMFVTNFSPPTSVGERIELSVSFQVSGAVTFAAHS